MDNGIFVFKFSCEEDKQAVVEGPWNFGKIPMIVRSWDPSLELKKTVLDKIPVWITLPHLPFQFWSLEALGIIGSVVGRPICFDKYTIKKEHLSYAYICVEVDASVPLKDCKNCLW